MYRLPLPVTPASVAYLASVNCIQDDTRRDLYIKSQQTVLDLCDEFDVRVSTRTLDQVDGSSFEVPGLPTNAMSQLYDNQFSKRQATRTIRDGIRNSAENALCPYCGQGTVTQLDHYLPKAHFAATTIHPANLVPACSDCNKLKGAYRPGGGSPTVLHPYFDAEFDTPWLSATVSGRSDRFPAVAFEVTSDLLDRQLEARLNAHLKIFDLRRRFSVWAAQLMTQFEFLIASQAHQPMTLSAAQDYLQRLAIQHSGGRANSWEGATYVAMVQSDWYLTERLGLS